MTLVIVACTLPAAAQSREGEIRVRVADPAGYAVAASLTLDSVTASVHLQLQTDALGHASFPRLPFGDYQVVVKAAGFAAATQAVSIRSSVPVALQIALQPASAQQTVSVVAGGALVDPHATGRDDRVSEQMISRAAVSQPGRAVDDLVNVQPGWLMDANGVLHPRGSEYQVQFVIDGLPLTDNRSPAFAGSSDEGDVQSMTVMTANYPAEYGRKLGGVVEVETKRPISDGFHGESTTTVGSFGTIDQFLMGEYKRGSNAFSASAEAARTDRYLDAPTLENFTDYGGIGDVSARFEHEMTSGDRFDLSLRRNEARFDVPNELLQQQAGQRQKRGAFETAATAFYQHIFSSQSIGTVSGMLRELSADLASNAQSVPLIATQDRGFREGYAKTSYAFSHGNHSVKVGADADFSNIQERFSYQITRPGDFDPDTPLAFRFFDRGRDREQSIFAQYGWRPKRWTLDVGLRWDHYSLLVDQSALSPRIGIARYFAAHDLLLHASYDRIFQTPAIENLLLASAPQVMAVSSEIVRLPVRPSLGNFYELGVTKGFAGKVRADASYYRRDFTEFADDDVFLDTGISFPIAFRSANIYGAEAKISVPRWRRTSGAISYSYMLGIAYLPVTGGLLLGDDVSSATAQRTSFPISQDQRHTARANVRYELTTRIWIGADALYGSGLPVEFDGTTQDVLQQYGPQVLNQLDLARGRVRPSLEENLSAGATLWQAEPRSVEVQAGIENLSDRVNVINFAGLFSGTAIAPPRSWDLRLRLHW